MGTNILLEIKVRYRFEIKKKASSSTGSIQSKFVDEYSTDRTSRLETKAWVINIDMSYQHIYWSNWDPLRQMCDIGKVKLTW